MSNWEKRVFMKKKSGSNYKKKKTKDNESSENFIYSNGTEKIKNKRSVFKNQLGQFLEILIFFFFNFFLIFFVPIRKTFFM